MNGNNKIVNGLKWKFAEQFGVSIIQFSIQVLLARLLGPDLYGVLALMVIFINIANVFIHNGFNISLIQNKELKEEDYSSVFWVVLGIAILLNLTLFFIAPVIASFYELPEILIPFRVLTFVLIPGSLNSIQYAKVSREMDFKKIFFSDIIAALISGGIGLYFALNGGGIWALVLQSLSYTLIACITMWFYAGWRPKLVFDFNRLKILFSFGWKYTTSSLLETINQELSGMIIGKKYNTENLAFYDRGNRISQFLINSLNGSIQSVYLPAMSSIQEEKDKVRFLLRKMLIDSSYIVFPVMFGLAGIASTLVRLLLTEEWMGCVPYIRIFCFSYAFWPIHTCNLQTYTAIGRSDVYLKIELIKKIIGLLALIIAVIFFDSPLAIAFAGLILTFVSWYINSLPNKKFVNYSFIKQIIDIFPIGLISVLMFFSVILVEKIDLNIFLLLAIQIIVGVIVYIVFSLAFHLDAFFDVLSILRKKDN